jgi:hypothetical protein
MDELVKTWGPFAVAVIAAGLAWFFRRRERLDEAYAAWVLLLEGNRDLRAAVNLLSDMNDLGTDSPERLLAPLPIPRGAWRGQFFFERKLRRLEMFVSDLADAGFLDRWNVRLREPTWEPMPPRNDRPASPQSPGKKIGKP